jgi:hypothetical protein
VGVKYAGSESGPRREKRKRERWDLGRSSKVGRDREKSLRVVL